MIYTIPAIVLMALLTALGADAAEYKQFYLTEAGRQIEATEAILASAKGDNVYKCQSVEFKVSKSGTSIGIKNVKKPKKD